MSIINLNTWFICSNCNEKKFISNGMYNINDEVFCLDCMEDLNEEEYFNDLMENFTG